MIVGTSGGTSRNLIIGRGGNSGPKASGQYTISGGTLTYDNSNSVNDAKLMVGASPNATGSTGTFTVVGNAASITMKSLYVGSDGTANRGGTCTMEFQVASAGVSPVKIDKAVILDALGASSTANLLVSLTGAAPTSAIVLIETTGTTAVSGMFDTLNGGWAGEGAWVQLAPDVWFQLTYTYNSGDGNANDIALLVPEPATIALLSLGLFAIRRRK